MVKKEEKQENKERMETRERGRQGKGASGTALSLCAEHPSDSYADTHSVFPRDRPGALLCLLATIPGRTTSIRSHSTDGKTETREAKSLSGQVA